MTAEEWKAAPLAKAATAFLQDLHHHSAVLEYKPQHLAVAAINLALQVGVLPSTNELRVTCLLLPPIFPYGVL